MVDPVTIAAGASAVSGMMGYKGNRASAKSARQVGEYNAQVAENEAVLLQRATRDQERNLRINSERLAANQRVMTAASGVQMTGSPLNALATTFFGTEEDAALIRSAGNIAELNKLSEAALTRVQAGASAATFRYKSYGSLLSGASGMAEATTLK
tara:strand:- start:2370 stop:2834 length:465 start_codon:yes stop_codon:yes gene_type:complete